ncbi:NAD-dependent protein deacetylase [Neptuniibacter halophilus]|uniref:NAD-dependent protein deacetylase n=1 Tax=Neptuniibacter halophilus TaxID=651666 RepID=UPI002572A5A7|nr:NAD-dependent protein deacetylase [Neptuniibacter halophilus]
MSHAEQLADFIHNHPDLVVLTGAGVSTDSGIPAYRDRDGKWQHSAPVQHKEYMQSHYARQRYWARSLIGWPLIRDAEPGPAHRALAELERLGHIRLLITQNVDRLHQRSGSRNVLDLHGRSDRVKCMQCEEDFDRRRIHQRSAVDNPGFEAMAASPRPDGDADLESEVFKHFNVPECEYCGGILKPDVVYYGDNVPKQRVFSALDELQQADALLTIGSSLMVYSGYRFCKKAAEWSKPIAALNLGMTRADPLLSLKLDAPVAATLETAVALLKGN